MKTLAFTWWKDESHHLGFLNMYPDYETQGDSLEELQENLKELFFDIESGSIPYIRHTADLIIA